ncbi:hypothetical protein V1520DRAFT_345133 [Lipomyces starkeyi]
MLSLTRPFELLRVCTNLCLFSAISLGVLYLFFGAFALVFLDNHGFLLYQLGLSFLGILVGMVNAILLDPLFHRYYAGLVQAREAAGGEPDGSEPEYQ